MNVDRYDDRVAVMANLIDCHEKLIELGIKHLPEKFFLEKDQIFTYNANKALKHGIITLQIPVAKSPIIASFFKQSGRVDELSSKVRNLCKYMLLHSETAPVFNKKRHIQIDLHLDKNFSPNQGKSRRKVSRKSLNYRETIHKLTIDQMVTEIDINYRTIKKHLANLKAIAVIQRIGPDKSGKWVVIEQDKSLD